MIPRLDLAIGMWCWILDHLKGEHIAGNAVSPALVFYLAVPIDTRLNASHPYHG